MSLISDTITLLVKLKPNKNKTVINIILTQEMTLGGLIRGNSEKTSYRHFKKETPCHQSR